MANIDIDLARALRHTGEAVEARLSRLLVAPPDGAENRVFEAMRYAALGGGKRLRAFLVTASAAMFGVDRDAAIRVAAAVEMLQAYSLVHDDLPAMDDADLRRGQPSCHIRFDEATAILAGDALLTLAFEVLAAAPTHADPAVRCALTGAMAVAAGGHGMVGGQMIDLAAEHQALDMGAITRLQRLKTGALIAFSCEAGAILGKASTQLRHALQAYAHDLGLAYQITDDLLDTEGSEADTGKTVGQDAEAGKATFVSILGVERARTQARMLADQAIAHLDGFDAEAEPLRQVARYVATRTA